MKKPRNGRAEGVVYLEGMYRPMSEVVAEVDALLGGPPSTEPSLVPKTLDATAIWARHNSHKPFKGIR